MKLEEQEAFHKNTWLIATVLNVSINDIIFLESNLQNVESEGETKWKKM